MATMKNRVIWQEGLFVLPQHFQQQQRNHEYHLNQRMDALDDFAWGFTSLVLNTELLAQGKIMIDRASGRMERYSVSLNRIIFPRLFSLSIFQNRAAWIFISPCQW